jgi:hypothetical protein
MVHAPAGLTGAQLTRLRDVFGGEIVTPADDDYDDARRLWNAVHDKRPAVIVRPTTNDEVAIAVRFAQLKRVWDPDNVFRLDHNFPPAE